MKIKMYFFAVVGIVSTFILHAQPKQFSDPTILSFESNIAPAIGDAHSQLSLNTEHFKHLKSSLNWKWNAALAQWSIKQPIDYKLRNMKSKDNGVSTFVFWVYAKNSIKEGKLKVEFLKNGRVCSFFEYGLDFTGWRGAWVAFDRDMQGKPEIGMDEMRITAPNINSGELFFDHIMLSSLQDVRQHTADFQAPFVNPSTTNHWLILLSSSKKNFDTALQPSLSVSEQKSIAKIQKRLTEMLLDGKKAISVKKLTDALSQYQIRQNSDGTLNGLPVFFERYGETYEYLGAQKYNLLFNNAMGLTKCNQLLFNLAVSYNKNPNPSEKSQIAALYVLLMRHLLDQGFQAGSALGTLHHLGYSMRNFYPAAFLMKEPLEEAHLDQQVQQAMEWFAGTGEIKTQPTEPGMDIDAFNTSLVGRLSSILMLRDSPEKSRYLQAFTRWIDNGFLFTKGTSDAFKPDGTIFHHRGNYPAYSVGGLEGAVTANYLLCNTDFQLNTQGRMNLKNALMAMRTYCNLQTWPLSLSGRHPDGTGHLVPEHFALMALTGAPDYSTKIDNELAAAYLRLDTTPDTKFRKLFLKAGIKPEMAPSGNWSYNYSCLAVHRRDNWMVSAMGFSRYLWATETYVGANLYGRYLNHGNLQILATGNPISNFGSGYNQEGWDWNHFPGTTAAVLPMNELRANVKNLDAESGYEEMLLSDEAFAGSLSSQNKQGVFAMKLRENPKYNGSLHARKSYFFFDNRVVALGSGICSDLVDRPVNTTLFQVYLPIPETAIYVDDSKIVQFPYSQKIDDEKVYLSDGLNNWFFVKNGNVELSKSLQKSLDEETDAPTQNNFALAAINHGAKPKNASYEYMVLLQPKPKELKTTVKTFDSSKQLSYEVLQQDSLAHIVTDKVTNSVGFALFEAAKLSVKSVVLEVDKPCLLMTTPLASNRMAFSACNPDLNFYDGRSESKVDANGQTVEKSVYSMTWKDNESIVSDLIVHLNGKWMLESANDYISVLSVDDNNTKLCIKCQHGLSREAVLIKK